MTESFSERNVEPQPYVYVLKCVEKVTDGDTMDLVLDLGFSVTLGIRVRLLNLNAPEIRTRNLEVKAEGLKSLEFVNQWFDKPGQVLVRTVKEARSTRSRKEKYGRYLADCFRKGEPSLCSELLQRGLAKPSI